MSYLVAAIATLILAIGALGVVVPERLVAILSVWSPDTLMAVGIATRLAIGVIFLAGASRCRIPAVITGIGLLALAGAVLLVLLGEPRVDALVQWWTHLPSLAIRAWCALTMLIGALVLYAALPDRPSRLVR
jgi:hypothetical protein